MWVQDIEMAIEALKMQTDFNYTLIERISSDGPFIIFITTGGTKYLYDVRYGNIQSESKL